MRLTSYINNQKCLEWGLNLQQGALFDLLYQSSSWAEPVYQDGEVFYWISKNKICEELPVAYSKPDTAYRALKLLADKGLIYYIKVGAKDCISLTDKGRTWNSEINPSSLGNKSESRPQLGNKSEQTRKNIRKSSEINPTYKTTIDNSTNDNKNTSANESKYSDQFEAWWEKYPKKVGKGKAWMIWKRDKLDKKSNELIQKLSDQVAMQYAFTEQQYIPHASTYLNESRYDDDVQPLNAGGHNATRKQDYTDNSDVARARRQAEASYQAMLAEEAESSCR